MRTVFGRSYILLLLVLVTFSCRIPSLRKESQVSDTKGAELIKVGLFDQKNILFGSTEPLTTASYCSAANDEAFATKCKPDVKGAFTEATIVRKSAAPGTAAIYSTDVVPAENIKVHIKGLKADKTSIDRIFSLKSSKTPPKDSKPQMDRCAHFSEYIISKYASQRMEKNLPPLKMNEALCKAAQVQSEYLAKIKFVKGSGKSPHTENTTFTERAKLAGYKGTNTNRELYLGLAPAGTNAEIAKEVSAWMDSDEFKKVATDANIDEIGFYFSDEEMATGRNVHMIFTSGKAP